MPSLSLGIGLHKNRVFTAGGGGAPPIPQSGLALWLKADAGVTTSAETFVSQIILTGSGTTTSDGTYTRASGGLTGFTGPNGNTIGNSSGEEFTLYDSAFGGDTYLLNITSSGITYINEIETGGASPVPTSSVSLSNTGNVFVTTWADQSSSGNNFSPSNGAAIKYNNIIGSNPAVLFNGPRLAGSNIDTAKTIYAVIKTLENSASQYAVILEATGGSLYSAINGTEWGSYFNAGIGAGQTLPTSTAAIIATISDDGATYEYRKNGQQVLTNTDGGGFYTRSEAYLGNDGSAGQAANVYVSEIIVYDRVPTSTEIQQIETYLNTKYAIY